jgi:rhomboid protease GluP
MCPHCRAFITSADKVCPYCDAPVGPRAIEMRGGGDFIAGLIPPARFASTIFLSLNIAIFVILVLASTRSGNGGLMGVDQWTMVRYGAAAPLLVFRDGEWWRLLTAGFLHWGLMHILFNSWAMMDVAANTEEIYGTPRMVAIYLGSTASGFLASMMWLSRVPVAVSAGASAGLFGLLGAMVAVGVLHKGSSEAAMLKEYYLRWAIYAFLWSLLPFFHADNAAHAGGFAGGFLIAMAAGTKAPYHRPADKLWNVIAGLFTILAGLSFVRMVMWLLSASA